MRRVPIPPVTNLRGPALVLRDSQQTGEDLSPFAIAEVELVGSDEADGIDQGVEAAKAVEIALAEGQGTWVSPTRL